MDLGRLLLDLVAVLLAARVAAEGAERVRQPAVLAEIAVGILIGPSALGLVRPSVAISLLGQIGVVLLLFEVGRQMDLDDLLHVGGASLRVAAIGVAVPMALGYVGMRAAGISNTPSVFLAAGITATSVGITARVFGDLRALARTEARTVLGAAVADDVIGLLVLTVVVGTASGGGLNPGSLVRVIGLAVVFVAAAALLGSWLVPRVLDAISRRARTEGTVMAVGLALALAFARLAVTAQLAPIVGAFVAGMAVGRSQAADDLHRRLTPLGHFFIPIFFLQIGIDTRLSAFGNPWVLGVAGILCAAAVAGKLVSGIGAGRGSGDRLLVGMAMIPRGEVGLIFASLGLARGVLDARTYAVLLVVVLVTTLLTPPLVRRRLDRSRRAAITLHSAVMEPPGGWLQVTDREIELAADPPPTLAGVVGLRAAALCALRRPGNRLLGWLAESGGEPTAWDEGLRAEFFDLLLTGSERSWRLLEVTELLPALAPELAAAIARRPKDPFDLEPAGSLRLPVLESLQSLLASLDEAALVWKGLGAREPLLLAALVRSVTEGRSDAGDAARRIAASIGLPPDDVEVTALLVVERHLLPAASARFDLGTETQVLDLAAYVGTADVLDGLYVLAVAENAMEPWERDRLDALWRLVAEALAHPDLTGGSASELVDLRRRAVAGHVPHLAGPGLERFMAAAPRRYLLAHEPATIAHHVRLAWSRPHRNEARLHAEPGVAPSEWTVHVSLLDRRGVLAAVAGAFATHGVSVVDAQVSTWRSGIAIDVFRVVAPSGIRWDEVRASIEQRLRGESNGGPAATVEGLVEIDNLASPWHTIVEVEARDRSGLLYRVASALSTAGFQIHQATVTTWDGVARDTFWVTGRTGDKLDATGERELRAAFAGRAPRSWMPFGRKARAGAARP